MNNRARDTYPSDAVVMAGWIVIGTIVGVFCAAVAGFARRYRITRRH